VRPVLKSPLTTVVVLLAGVLTLIAAGAVLRMQVETVYWIGPRGGGHYQRPSELLSSVGAGFYGAAGTLAVLALRRLRHVQR
jgi:hypothetical protein